MMKEIMEFIKEAKMFFIATLEAGQPRVRPFGELLYFNERLFFNTGKTKDVYKQLVQHPKIECCSFNKGQWIRVKAKAVENYDQHVLKAMLDSQPAVARRYKDQLENFAIFELTDIDARLYKNGGCITLYEDSKN